MEIQGALDDQKCELGQFIRLQEMNRECQGWTLERLLVLPVNRLASYQDLFAVSYTFLNHRLRDRSLSETSLADARPDAENTSRLSIHTFAFALY
jgi:hypothetical protein